MVRIIVLLIMLSGTISAVRIMETAQLKTSDIHTRDIQKTSRLISGNILYVGGTGPYNYSEIQDAIDNASDFDCIFVFDEASPYYEHIIIDKPLILIGEDKNTTIIDGNNSNCDTVVDVISNNVIIQGFTVQNSNWSSNGITVSARYITVSDCIVGEHLRDGIMIDRSTLLTIVNNVIVNNDIGIHLVESFETSIIRNIIKDNWEDGVKFESSYKNTIIDNLIVVPNKQDFYWKSGRAININGGYNTITGNLLIGNGAYDIGFISADDHNTIRDNIFCNLSLYLASSKNTVENNTINGKPLLFLVDKSNISINNAGQVILIQCANIAIQNLTISKIGIGVEIRESSNCKVIDNNFSNNKVGIKIISSQESIIADNIIDLQINGGICLSESHNNILERNFLTNNSYAITLSNSNTNLLSTNEIKDNRFGIELVGADRNIISLNNIHKNKAGVYLEACRKNMIIKNNIFNNEEDAFFVNAVRNKWSGNYWNKIQYPYLISGMLYIDRGDYWGAPPPIMIPLLQFDWFPAQNPYILME